MVNLLQNVYIFTNASGAYDWGNYAVYGDWHWNEQYGRAEWSEAKEDEIERTEAVVCPVNPEHNRNRGVRIGDLVVVLPSPRIADFMWTWYYDCLITDRVRQLFEEAGLTGFTTRPVEVERVKRLRKGTQANIPRLWELVVTGHAQAAKEMHIERERCDACGYDRRLNDITTGIMIDASTWDGSDFFKIVDINYRLATEAVRKVITENQLINCSLVPAQFYHLKKHGFE
ncbi:MAG: hypothetical protein M0031_11220 [Thermaerobacter sp.]|nr:hypothetical protein [Thermaerobacter sp.]